MPFLFVYGTLQRGCRNHRHLAAGHFLGDARTGPGWTLYDLGGFPGLVAAPGESSRVYGELWEVGPDTLARLDLLENVPAGVYTRDPVPLEPPAPVAVDTYVYRFGVTGRTRLPHRWREPRAGSPGE